jgi:hypothetical protein
MKEYPKTFGFHHALIGKPCVAFYKYDGSNLRFEYSRKQKKWYKFGTRRHLFAEGDPEYGASLPIFFKKYADGLAKVFHDTKSWRSVDHMIVFAEYFGPHSFAGRHDPQRLGVENNDPKDLVLFDVNIHRKGLLGPEEFLKYFGHLPVAEVVCQGLLTEKFFKDVRENKYSLNEGVMCKGSTGHDLWMCKIKTLSYLKKLKEMYAERWNEFWE